MIKIALNWTQRLTLYFRLGSAQVQNIREASNLIGILNLIKPTDREKEDSGFKIATDGRVLINNMDSGFGIVAIELDGFEADAMIKAINEFQNLRVDEADWMLNLIADIEKQKEQVSGDLVAK